MLPWIQTASGRKFPLINPKPTDVYWPDVAFHLAHINRFSGAGGTYSVLQHLVHPLRYLREEDRPYWLLHDAHEFAITDIPTPAAAAFDHKSTEKHVVKPAISAVKCGIDKALYASVGIQWPPSDETIEIIKNVDETMLLTECRDILGGQVDDWGFLPAVLPYPERIVPWGSPMIAYTRFGRVLKEYFGISLPSMYDVRLRVVQQFDYATEESHARMHDAIANS